MPRPIWNGALNFGLVTVPVELYSATEDHSLHFRQFERGTTDRIRYKRINERTGDEVAYENIVKGYEVDDGEYVLIEPEELDQIAPGRSRTIDIESFVDIEEIDPIFFQKSYWLVPGKEEFARAYGLLMRAMADTGKAGVAKFVMRGKEYVAVVRSGEQVLVLDTLLFAEDVRDPRQSLRKLPGMAEPRGKELDMAKNLIESMAAEWSPDDYTDTYTERVRELIEDKRAGRSVTPSEEPSEPTKVVDLFDALSRSVQRGKQERARQDEPPAVETTDDDIARMSKAELTKRARELNISGRSGMDREELASAVRAAAADQRAS